MKRKTVTKSSSKKKETKPTKRNSRTTKNKTAKQPLTKKNRLGLTKEEKEFIDLHQTLKLQIELVPESCWYTNVRSNTTQGQWNRIRKEVYAKANFVCEICGSQGTHHAVDCHEVWVYDDKALIQRLAFFQAICPSCHEVKHYGRAIDRGRALARFISINNLDESTAERIVAAVFKQWKIRSKKKWKLEIKLLEQFGVDITKLAEKAQIKSVKAAPKHYLTVDRNFDKQILKELVEDIKEQNPKHEVVVVYRDRKAEAELSKTPPSKITSQYWVQANRTNGSYPEPTKNSGKWLIFRNKSEIDAVWDKVNEATEAGLLGDASKVSTGKENPNSKNKNKGVICVYTYDWTDETDARRIREELRKIGVVEKIGYKSDQATREGKYSNKGDTQLTKYWE